MESKLINRFLLSAAFIVLVAALLRLSIVLQDALDYGLLLEGNDALLGLPLRGEVWLLVIIELLVAGGLFIVRNQVTRLWLLAWGITNYLFLKIAFAQEQIKAQTSFLGSLSDPFHLSQGLPGKVMGVMPLYLLTGTYCSLAWLGWRHFRETREHPVPVVQTGKDGFWKISCPACGGHLRFALQNEGSQIPCPHCAKPLKLRREDILRMSCFFCHEHISFPTHALGTKMPCPHCHKDITLKEG
jgi:hypothetical protein